MKITKKAIAVLLSLLIIAAVMPIPVFAAGAVEYSNDGSVYKTAASVADAFSKVGADGFVKLNDNVTSDSTVTVDKDVTLFGNGYTVTRAAGFDGAMFEFTYSSGSAPKAMFFNTTIDGNRTAGNANGPLLRINGGHVVLTAVSLINNVNNESWNNNPPAMYSCYGGAASVGTTNGVLDATLTFDSASKIINCSAGVAGAVIIWKNAEVVSNGANIKACSALYGDGGAVSLVSQGAKFTMNGGSITDCYSKGWGGAVCNEIGTLTLRDAVIKNNYVYSGGLGGGVFANQYKADGTNDAKIILSGSCVITDNYSVANDGTHNASNLYIYTKDAGNDIPEITLADDYAPDASVSITVDDASVSPDDFLAGDLSKINNNLVSDNDGYFYRYDSSTGKTEYKQGTKITLNAAGGTCDSKYVYTDTVYGALPKPYKVNYTFAGWYTASVGGDEIKADTPITSDSSRTVYAHWNIAEITFVKNGKTYGAATLNEAVEESQDGSIITLYKNTAIGETVVLDKNVAIKSASDANISTVSRAVGFKGKMFECGKNNTAVNSVSLSNIIIDGSYVYPASTAEDDKVAVDCGNVFTVYNSNVTASGVTIKNNYTTGFGSAILLGKDGASERPSFSLENGSIEACTAGNGGAVCVFAGTFDLKDSKISSCYSSGDAGAISLVRGSASCNITNGVIVGCSSKGWGGAINLEDGTLNINSAEITGNYVTSANGIGGGVLVCQYSGHTTQFNISGLINITGNTNGKPDDKNSFEENIYFVGSEFGSSGAKITVAGAVDLNSEIGISSEDGFADGKAVDCIGVASTVPASSVTGIFSTDKDKLYIFPQGNGFAAWEAFKVTLDANKSTCDVPYIIVQSDAFIGTLPTPAARDGFTFAGWFDSPKYGTGNQYTETSTISEDITLYAQWSNDNALDMNPLAVIGRFFTRLGEIMRIVFNFLKNLLTGGGIDDIITEK